MKIVQPLIFLLLSIVTIGSARANQTIFLPENMTLERIQQTPKEIAWNVFNTLYTREHSNRLLYAKACAKHPLITTSLASRLAYAYATKNQNSIRTAIEGIKKFPPFISAEGYLQWFKKCNEYGLATIALEAALGNKPISGMAALTQEIANHGCTQRIATNNSLRIQQIHQARLKAKYNDNTFDPITIGLTVDYSSWGPDKDIATENVTTFHKTQPEYFQTYNQLHNPDNSKVIVYISDSKEIIDEALKYGWVGILFNASKDSVAQLRNDLASLHILK